MLPGVRHHSRVPRIFISRDQLDGAVLVLEGDQAHHLRGPLRVQVGELILVVDDTRQEHGVRVSAVERGRVTGTVLWSRPAAGEPVLHVEVVQALVREVEEAIAALSEAGAAAIRPVVTRRGISRPDPQRASVRLGRWRGIAREAAELAHRGAVPAVHPVADLSSAIAELPPGTRILTCVVGAAEPIAHLEVDPGRPVALIIGPEGGLDPVELEALGEAGAEPVHLGPRVVPARRAGATAVDLLLARAGDLDHPAPPPPLTPPEDPARRAAPDRRARTGRE